MQEIPIALQLYSVRADCATDLPGVLDRVAAMGYEGVEFAGFHGHDPAELKLILDDLGLRCAGTHTGLDALSEANFRATIAAHHTLAAKFVIIPWLPPDMRKTPDVCIKTGQMLTELEGRVGAEGLRLGFHAHDNDMRPLEGGKSAWDLIAANTPVSFVMQYDTANGMSGGADPVQPLLGWPGRSACVHLKEYKPGAAAAIIGDGDVPWVKVLSACEGIGGTEWYVVEYEGTDVPSPMDAVDSCLQALRSMTR